MKERGVLVLLAAFLILGAAFFVFRDRWEKQEEAEQLAKKIVPFDATTVESIRLTNPHGKFELRKKAAKWQVVQPVKRSADSNIVSAMVRALDTLSIKRTFEDVSEEDRRNYGLVQVEYRLVAANDEGGEVELTLGKDTPTGNSLYAMRNGDPRVLVLDKKIRDRVNKSLHDLRDKTIFDFEIEEIERIEYKTPARTVAIFKEQPGSDVWRLEQPEGARANTGAVRAILNELKYAEAQGFPAESTGHLEQYNLVDPATTVSVFSATDEKSERIMLGNRVEGEDKVYALRAGSPDIIEVKQSLLDTIEKNIGGIRDRQLTLLDSWTLDRVRIESTTGTIFSATHEEEQWHMQEPLEGAMFPYHTTDYLMQLTQVRVEGFIDEAGSLDKYRLDPPDYRIHLASGTREEQILVGIVPSATGEREPQAVYAQRSDEESVLLVPGSLADLMHWNFAGLLEPEEANIENATEALQGATGN